MTALYRSCGCCGEEYWDSVELRAHITKTFEGRPCVPRLMCYDGKSPISTVRHLHVDFEDSRWICACCGRTYYSLEAGTAHVVGLNRCSIFEEWRVIRSPWSTGWINPNVERDPLGGILSSWSRSSGRSQDSVPSVSSPNLSSLLGRATEPAAPPSLSTHGFMSNPPESFDRERFVGVGRGRGRPRGRPRGRGLVYSLSRRSRRRVCFLIVLLTNVNLSPFSGRLVRGCVVA